MNIFMRKHTRIHGKKNQAPAQKPEVDNNPPASPENPRIKALSMPMRRVTAITGTKS